jgi:response regulator RpfG family c-di-GMP phosphodiesterase
VSQLTFHKLVLASLYHDLSLRNDDQARTSTLDALRLSAGNQQMDSIEQINAHPHHAVALLHQLKDVPPDVDQIILHHHEKPDGSGFPAGINHRSFTPLSALFVLAHDFVDYFIERPPTERHGIFERFLAATEEHYVLGHFKQIYRELRTK